MSSEQVSAGLVKALESALNRNGYGFQYSLIKAIGELGGKGRTDWYFDAAEFPFSSGNQDGRIDFVLRRRQSSWLLVGECKRANPALSNWCFARAPYVGRNSLATKILLQSVSIPPDAIPLPQAAIREVYQSERVYHLGFEIRSASIGDEQSEGRGAIEKAVGQAIRGVSGLVEWIATHPKFLGQRGGCTLLPVLFTTARLWTTENDLSEAELETGNIALSPEKVKETGWLWLNYAASASLGHSLAVPSQAGDLSDSLAADYVRSVAVVNPSGLAAFMGDQPWFY